MGGWGEERRKLPSVPKLASGIAIRLAAENMAIAIGKWEEHPTTDRGSAMIATKNEYNRLRATQL